MRRTRFLFVAVIFIVAVSCGSEKNTTNELHHESGISHENDGSIILDLEEAYLLQDSLHPDMNTAEWSFNIRNKGRYELWLSSFTKDTMDLKYETPVIINFRDKKIRANPVGNEIVLDTPGTGGVYFRADSRLGSVYIDEPGHYNIQIVSAKVRSADYNGNGEDSMHTQLKRLVLKPITE